MKKKSKGMKSENQTKTDLPEMVREMLTVKIEPEDIIFLIEQMAAQHQGGLNPDWYSAFAILADRFKGYPEKIFSITERMRCLTVMMKEPRMRGWTMKGIRKGCTLTNEAVFRSTALCKLHADKKHTWFDPDEFFEIALMETDTEARA